MSYTPLHQLLTRRNLVSTLSLPTSGEVHITWVTSLYLLSGQEAGGWLATFKVQVVTRGDTSVEMLRDENIQESPEATEAS